MTLIAEGEQAWPRSGLSGGGFRVLGKKKPRLGDGRGFRCIRRKSNEGSLAESLSCAKECGRRPHAILVAEPLKLIKPMPLPGRSGICHRRS